MNVSPTDSHPPQLPHGGRCLILIPAFNEGASVRRLVLRLRRALPTCDILVIDDGSTDDTVRQVPEGTAVVTLPFNLGIGGAMQAGYRYAALHGYDVAVQVDGDGQHRPREVGRLIAELERSGSDFIVGSRFTGTGRYRQTLSRSAGAWFLRGVIRTLTGLSVTDVTSGFRAANRRVIRAFAHWYPEDYPEPEVILLLHRSGYRVSELGVQMRQRKAGRSSIRLFDGFYYVAKVTICLVLDLIRHPWPRGKLVDVGGGTAQSGPASSTPAAAPPTADVAAGQTPERRPLPVHS